MQPFSTLLLALMAFVISLTSATAMVSVSVSVTDTYPRGHSGVFTESWKKETKTAWGEWTGKPKPSLSVSITDNGSPTTSTIHATSTEIVTAASRLDEELMSHSRGGMGSSWTGETGILKPSVSFMGTKSWTKADSGMTTVTIAPREEGRVDDSCTLVLFKGGGFCLPTSEAKRDVDLMTRSRHHSQHRSHHQSDASPANTSVRDGPGNNGKHTSKGMVSATVTSMMAPPTKPTATVSGYPARTFAIK